MTLELKLTEIKDLWGGASKPSYVYVEGSQSGSLVLEIAKLPQKIRCSTQDHLVFVICGSKSKNQPLTDDVIAKQDFWAASFIDQNRYKWQHEDQWYPCVIEYFNSQHEKQGELIFELKYNRGLFYQGEIQNSEVEISRKNLLSFYTGPCPTSNFYNCLDFIFDPNNNRKFKFIEHVYQDD